MIIKIQTAGENNWRFYDNARAVQCSVIPSEGVPQSPEPIAMGSDFAFADGDVWFEILMNKDMPVGDSVSLVSFASGKLTDGDHVNLYTNSTVYLLNDSGKTIERLY